MRMILPDLSMIKTFEFRTALPGIIQGGVDSNPSPLSSTADKL